MVFVHAPVLKYTLIKRCCGDIFYEKVREADVLEFIVFRNMEGLGEFEVAKLLTFRFLLIHGGGIMNDDALKLRRFI